MAILKRVRCILFMHTCLAFVESRFNSPMDACWYRRILGDISFEPTIVLKW